MRPQLAVKSINDYISFAKYTFWDIKFFASPKNLSYEENNLISVNQYGFRRCRSTGDKDLEVILQWSSDNLVEFNASKTQATLLTKKTSTVAPQLIMDNKTIKPTNGLKLLGVNISLNATWHEHVCSVAKSAAQKLSYLFRASKLFTPKQLLLLYKAQVRPAMEYCSHAWG